MTWSKKVSSTFTIREYRINWITEQYLSQENDIFGCLGPYLNRGVVSKRQPNSINIGLILEAFQGIKGDLGPSIISYLLDRPRFEPYLIKP